MSSASAPRAGCCWSSRPASRAGREQAEGNLNHGGRSVLRVALERMPGA
ncbi:MAG: hypothetical protein M3515_02000 [Actinomycetota bacterium]|nr:hypothetical protein [Actinomycetota bacterium]